MEYYPEQNVIDAIQYFDYEPHCSCGAVSNMCIIVSDDRVWTCLECYEEANEWYDFEPTIEVKI